MEHLNGLSVESMYHVGDEFFYSLYGNDTAHEIEFCRLFKETKTCASFKDQEYYTNMSYVSATTHAPECTGCWAIFYIKNGVEYQGINAIDDDIPVHHTEYHPPHRNPTAISYYKHTKEGYEYVVFFDNIYTVQAINLTRRLAMNEPACRVQSTRLPAGQHVAWLSA
ncbi:hypothetical protein HDE_09135 [Halotydeus destructor]|nr:hypothetical protein HDE_09135 [Halotydeus destructor]